VVALKAGKHEGREGVVAIRAPSLEVSTEPQLELSVDGEFAGIHTPAEFDVVAQIRVRAPRADD
jgi:diacylglycerol kinase family enzyme